MAKAYSLICTLRDCHQADNREQAIADIFSEKVHSLFFMSGRDELFDGTIERLAVDPAWGQETQKAVALYKRERSLIFAAFLISGYRVRIAGRERKLCAPLVFYPATIESEVVAGEPMFFAVPDFMEPRFNVPVLDALMEQQDSSGDLLEGLLADFPQPPLESDGIYELAKSLESIMPGIDVSKLLSFPDLVSESEMRKYYKQATSSKSSVFTCLPAAAFAMVDNPPETRGVLYELSALADNVEKDDSDISASLACVLGLGSRINAPASSTKDVPALLSTPQGSALDSASSADVTLLVGPPGTGKSFTAAALAIDCLTRGGSVLFASRTQQALDVIGAKLEEMLTTDAFVIRGGRHQYLKNLKDFLEQLLRGVFPLPEVDKDLFDNLVKHRAALKKKITAMERVLVELEEAERSLGLIVSGLESGFFSAISRPFRKIWLRKKVSENIPLWEMMGQYQKLLKERMEVISSSLKMTLRMRMERALHDHRMDLKHFVGALRARKSSRQENLFSQVNLQALLRTFPVWMTTMTGAHRVLPLEREMFDLVVIDEATQCDMATCLPIFHRAKRAVVIGDPKQLRHVSFLSRKRQALIADQYQIESALRSEFDYREKSILDRVESVVESQDNVVFLDEHFRSRPPIIAFSNKEFYSNSLKVMTMVPGKDERGIVQLRMVKGKKEPGGANDMEAEALVDEVVTWLEREVSLDESIAHSIGILSPFHKQVEKLQALAQQRLSAEAIEKHKIRIGTAYSFQGDERDVMFLSLAVDENTNGATYRYLNRPDVFNVSITRARNAQIIFCSIDPQSVSHSTLLGRYLSQVQSVKPPAPPSKKSPEDVFLQEVRSRLMAQGLVIFSAFPIAGLELDLVAVRDGAALGIDLIGHPGRYAPAFALERYQMLNRAGLDIFPLAYSAWLKSPDTCIKAICDMI